MVAYRQLFAIFTSKEQWNYVCSPYYSLCPFSEEHKSSAIFRRTPLNLAPPKESILPTCRAEEASFIANGISGMAEFPSEPTHLVCIQLQEFTRFRSRFPTELIRQFRWRQPTLRSSQIQRLNLVSVLRPTVYLGVFYSRTSLPWEVLVFGLLVGILVILARSTPMKVPVTITQQLVPFLLFCQLPTAIRAVQRWVKPMSSMWRCRMWISLRVHLVPIAILL